MDADSLVTTLLRIQLVASAAILLVLLLRPLALRWYGAGTAYLLWLVVPLAAVAVLLPAREQVVMLPTAPDIPILPQHMEPALSGTDLVVGVTREPATAAPVVQPGVPEAGVRSTLWIALWLLGAGVLLIRSIVNTRKLASSPSIGPALVGVLRPRLVLPGDFETRFSAEERVLILAHEERHRLSRHTLVNALVEVVRCAGWFNPLLHWAARRFRADQELACDTAVIAAHPEARRTYAEALLKAQGVGVYLPMGCVWNSGTAGRLGERIARLSEQSPGHRRRVGGVGAIAGICIAASYAAWAQQPARIILAQQPNPDSAAVVVTETSAPAPVRAAAAPAAPVALTMEAELEPATPAIDDGSASRERDMYLRMRRLAASMGENLATMTAEKQDMLRNAIATNDRWREQLKDPEYRKLVLAQARAGFVNRYPGVAQELGLSRTEAESLIDLLAANEVARLTRQNDTEEARQTARELIQIQEESIQTLLGGKYAQWKAYQDYQQAILLRVGSWDRQLAVAGIPLTQAQRFEVTHALVAERVRRSKELGVPLNSACILPVLSMPACTSLPDLERQVLPANLPDQAQMVEEEVRRTLQAIEPKPHTPHLNDDQLAVVREQVQRLAADYLKFMQAERERLQTQLPQ